MRTCLVITGTYNGFLYWCENNRFEKRGGYHIKYEWKEGNFKILKKAKYVSRPEDLIGYDRSKIDIIKAGNFRANPLYRNGYSHLIDGLESKIKSVWDRSYMSQIDQEFDKLLEEL